MNYYRINYSAVGMNVKTAIIPAESEEAAIELVKSSMDSANIRTIAITNRNNAISHYSSTKLDLLQVTAIVNAIPENLEPLQKPKMIVEVYDGNGMVVLE